MKFIKQILFLTGMSFLMAGIMGCSNVKEEDSKYHVYYIKKEKTKTVAVGHEPQEEGATEQIREFVDLLFEDTQDPDYRKPAFKGVELEAWKLEKNQLSLYFNSEYLELDHVEEVLCRAAIVRTLIQVDGVECISFYVGDTPLVDSEGTPVGLMTVESFIENPGEQINTIQTANITLYFANEKGDGLVREIQEIHYSSNISLEKLVMEQLLRGPRGRKGQSAIPDGTKLVGVSVLDGVCFVNLSEGFLNQNYEIKEPVVIYSIANSLAELPDVNKVQISVNGDSNKVYREKMDLSVMYERNLDYLDDSERQKNEMKMQSKEKEEPVD